MGSYGMATWNCQCMTNDIVPALLGSQSSTTGESDIKVFYIVFFFKSIFYFILQSFLLKEKSKKIATGKEEKQLMKTFNQK